MVRFLDRTDAGRQLAEQLSEYTGREDVVVLALPRGGVPVAYEVAQALQAPLDVFLVRKLGLPGHEELAMGAIASENPVAIIGAQESAGHHPVLNRRIEGRRGVDAIEAHSARLIRCQGSSCQGR